MAFPSQDKVDIIATKIVLEARDALVALAGIGKNVDDAVVRIEILKNVVSSVAQQLGGNFSKAEAAVKRFSGSLTGISSEEIRLATNLARQENVELQKIIAARVKENNLVEQSGASIARKLAAQERLAQAAAKEAAAREMALIEQAGTKTSDKLLAKQRVADQAAQAKILAEEQKIIAAREKENILIEQAGQKLSNQLLAQQRISDAQKIIPNFVKKNFGDINSYIAQSSNKVAAWKEVVQRSANAAGVSFEQAGSQLKKMVSGTSVAPLNTALKQLGNDGRGAFQKLIDGAHFARIALGALVSMILFQGIQAVTSFFTNAAEQARKFEDTLYRLQNAERALSMEGVEVTLKGLKQGIIDIQKLFPIFSKEDVASLVGILSVSTKQLGLNEQQILDLAKAIAVLNIRSEKQEDIQTTAQHVLSSLLTGNAKGISALGIAFTDNTMTAKAMEMGFLKAGEALSKLSENEKGLVKLSLLLESTGQEMEGVGEYLDTNSAKLQQNKAAWADLQTTVGQVILPFIPALTEFFQLINDGFQGGKVLIIEFLTALGTLGVVLASVFTGQIKSVQDFTDVVKTSIETLRTDLTNQLFKEVPDNAPDWFMKGWGNRIKEEAETATGPLNDMYAAAEDSEDAEKALADIEEKIQDIILDAKQAQEDLDLKLEQKQQDLDTEYARKQEDAARDHAQKLVDIDLDARRKAEDAKAKLREDEKKAEQDLLQKLKELRQRFLLDLEDALHARDARQVLRLIKEYKLEKQNILDRKKLEDQQRKESLAEDLRQIELERQRRIQNENIEYQRRLDDLSKAKAREQEELQLWYQREQEDIQRNVQQKLEKLLAGYIAEGKIHESEQARIYAILAKYFAKDMALVDSMAQFMAARFAQMSAYVPAIGSLNAQLGLGQGVNPFAGTAPAGSLNANQGLPNLANPFSSRYGFAEGGTYIADRPTAAIFGENGREAATFTPLGRTGRDVNKVFGDVSGGGVNGQIMVAVDLSPDLEGRIINRSLDGVAEVVGRVNRRKF